MAVRQKLNTMLLGGIFALASVVGLVTQSLGGFILSAVVLFVLAVHHGSLRLYSSTHQRPR